MGMAEDKLYVLGAAARRELGHQTDIELLETVDAHPGLSIYELKKLLDWSFGRTHGSLQRLKSERKLQTRVAHKNGKLAQLVFPYQWVVKEDPRSFFVEKKLLDDPSVWGIDKANAYCLTKATLGISPTPNPAWKDSAIYSELVDVETMDKQIKVTLSDKLSTFFMIGNSEIQIAALNSNIVVSFLEPYLPISGEPRRMKLLESQLDTREQVMALLSSRTSRSLHQHSLDTQANSFDRWVRQKYLEREYIEVRNEYVPREPKGRKSVPHTNLR